MRRPSFWNAPFSLRDISPNFLLLLGIWVVAGLGAYFLETGFSVFLFVTVGWIVAVCLHEFGHAIFAYYGGDRTVQDKGYLTIDPLKYVNPLLSIILPVIFIILGGIGLPGAAVYIQIDFLRSRKWISLTSAGGPIATFICLVLLCLPFVFGLHLLFDNFVLWSALAMLAFFQATALLITLIPLPGLDGYGIIEPWLPYSIAMQFNRIRPYTLLILFGLLMLVPFFGRGLSLIAFTIVRLMGVNAVLINSGFELFRFWESFF